MTQNFYWVSEIASASAASAILRKITMILGSNSEKVKILRLVYANERRQNLTVVCKAPCKGSLFLRYPSLTSLLILLRSVALLKFLFETVMSNCALWGSHCFKLDD